MQILHLLTTGLAAALLPFMSSATPVQPPSQVPKYFLKVNAPEEPWHGRHIVKLPTSGRLGLENFTIHPETPPVWLIPVLIRTEPTLQWALQVNSDSDDVSKVPLIAALTSNLWTGDKAASLRILEADSDSPTDVSDACPDTAECTADGWNVDYDGSDRPAPVTFGGFPGAFTAAKDASPEGWHVYWESTEGKGYAKKPKRGTEIGLEVWFHGLP